MHEASPKGQVTNSQVKGLISDETLESTYMCTDEVNLSGKADRAHNEHFCFLCAFFHIIRSHIPTFVI